MTDNLYLKLKKQIKNDETYNIKKIERRDAFIYSASKHDGILNIGIELKLYVFGEKRAYSFIVP